MGSMRMPTVALVLAGCAFDPGGGGGASGVGGTGGTTSVDSGPSSTTAASPTTAADITSAAPDTTEPGTTSAAATTPGASGEPASTSTSAATEDTTAAGSTGEPACVEVLWVRNAGDATVFDATLIDRLELAGFILTEVQDDLVQAADADGRCAVVIAGSVDSTDVNTKLRDVDAPVLVIEYNLYDDMGFALEGAFGVIDGNDLQVLITDGAHPLAAGKSGAVKIWDGAGRMGWALPVGANVVAANPDFLTQAVLFEFPVGAALIDGGSAQGLRIALPFMDGGTGTPTADALDLFEAAIHYATGS